jgi:acetoacetate decarboxylase
MGKFDLGEQHIRTDMWGSEGTSVQKMYLADRIEIIVCRELQPGSWWDMTIELRRDEMSLETMKRLEQQISKFAAGMYQHGQRDKEKEVRRVIGL